MLPYVVPFGLYLIVPLLTSLVGLTTLYSDIGKIIFAGAAIIYYWKDYKEIRLKWSWDAILIGALVIFVWIAPEYLAEKLGFTLPSWYGADTEGFNPFELGGLLTIISLIARFISSCVIAPIIEELFTRSYLIRALISKDFRSVPMGHFTWSSFIITVIFFGFAHDRWLVGLIAGIILNIYLYKTKDIFSCIQAHAWANAFLYIFIIMTGGYAFW